MAQEQKKKTIKKEKIIDFPKEMFESIENKSLLTQAVRVFLANQRQGNASTKTRGEVHGTTKKVYKQKGTGRARHGAKKAPIFVGGGVAGGPKPRDYSLKLNKQQKKIALICALTLKRNEKKLLVFENKILSMKPKTQEFVSIMKEKGISGQSVLLVFGKMEKNNMILAARNIPKVDFSDVYSLNPYILMNHEYILFIEDALPVLSKKINNL